jgi:prepilin-type N-terminal cleavage/methylation domain-containing protein
MKTRRRRTAGFSLVETMITTAVIAIALGGFGMAVVGTQKSSIEMRDRDMRSAQAMKYMERLLRLPFGTAADPAATVAQVAELFDDNSIVTGGAPVTLKSLETPLNAAGWRFRVEGFEITGVWEIEVNRDLDGNGTFRGVRGTETPTSGYTADVAGDGASVVNLQSENDPNMLRIEVFFNGTSVMRALRCAPIEGT